MNENIEEKLASTKYKIDEIPHLKVDEKACSVCDNKVCTKICPASVYNEFNNKIIVNYENCLECGACKIVCKSISWKYLKGGYGVIYKNS